ncbi:hypothetical protein H3V53_13230 [Paraburkholderia bengalensis]|uniref:Uncharacterized protein n=1 Tax=Paraburkholderia bengalensis TaxID=2747562 RepID=A0ABU8IR82_9BURK
MLLSPTWYADSKAGHLCDVASDSRSTATARKVEVREDTTVLAALANESEYRFLLLQKNRAT